jgi:lipoprotein-anchoring transpeptidase ErfK/SrfK
MYLRKSVALVALVAVFMLLPDVAGATTRTPELPVPSQQAKEAAATGVVKAALTQEGGAQQAQPDQSGKPEAAAEREKATQPAKPDRVPKAAPRRLPPTLVASIDLTSQRMTVRAGGKTLHSWKISSGRAGYETPTGTFRPNWMARDWHSRKYDMAPMPYSVFFNGGIATHGTTSVRGLGRPASHGCIRLETQNAKAFYELVRKHGKARTRIAVVGTTPASEPRYAAPRRPSQAARGSRQQRLSGTSGRVPSNGAAHRALPPPRMHRYRASPHPQAQQYGRQYGRPPTPVYRTYRQPPPRLVYPGDRPYAVYRRAY